MGSPTFICRAVAFGLLLGCILTGLSGCRESGKSGQKAGAIIQKTCVYDKNPIDSKFVYETKKGRKIYFCSEACRHKFETDAALNPDLKPDAM